MFKWNYLLEILCGLYIIILLPLYIRKQKQVGAVKAVGYKLTLSGIFCMVGLASVIRHSADKFSTLIFLGLVFSLVGDYFLIYIKADVNKFLKGIFCFGIAHVLYITAISLFTGFHLSDVLVTLAIIIPITVIKMRKKLDIGKVDLPLSCYTVLITLMAVKAVLMMFNTNNTLVLQELFSVGAFLFFVSDAFLGVWRYIDSKKIFSYIVSICYFIGQLMIATAVLYQ